MLEDPTALQGFGTREYAGARDIYELESDAVGAEVGRISRIGEAREGISLFTRRRSIEYSDRMEEKPCQWVIKDFMED